MTMKPTRLEIKKWEAMTDSNAITEALEDMSKWLAAATIGLAPTTHDGAQRYADIFHGIRLIHDAEGYISEEIYTFRHRAMGQWLHFVKGVSPETFGIFTQCL